MERGIFKRGLIGKPTAPVKIFLVSVGHYLFTIRKHDDINPPCRAKNAQILEDVGLWGAGKGDAGNR